MKDVDWGAMFMTGEDGLEKAQYDKTKAKALLSDSFFESCPGLVGEVTREILAYSIQPYPAFAFAAACTVIGGLKASYLRSDFSATTSNLFFFCFAPAGRGKDFPRKALVNALGRMGRTRFLTQRFRSAQGFHSQISRGGSVQIILQDEAHHFFTSTKNSGEYYLQSIKPLLLELFSGWNNSNLDPGTVITSTSKLEPLIYPAVSYCGFGVPEGLETTFAGEELVSGFLSRFIVFEDCRDVVAPTETMPEEPREFAFESDPRLLEILSNCEKYEMLRKTHSEKPHQIEFLEHTYTDDAKEAYLEFSRKIADKRNRLPHGKIDVCNRAVELAGKISLALSDGPEITIECVEWATELVQKYLIGIEALAYSGEVSEASLENEKVHMLIAGAGPEGITRSELQRKCSFLRPNGRQKLDSAIKDLTGDDKISMFKKLGTGAIRRKQVTLYRNNP